MPFVPSATHTPYEALGGEPAVRVLVEHFYDAMSTLEPPLAALHPCDADGRVSRGSRDRFALFFIGWLGGPQAYVAQFGHPRLGMRHARVPIDTSMSEAWMRCMRHAFDECGVTGDIRGYLDARLGEVAAFLRNRERA